MTHCSHHQTTSPQSPLVLEMMDLDNGKVHLAPDIGQTIAGPRRSENTLSKKVNLNNVEAPSLAYLFNSEF